MSIRSKKRLASVLVSVSSLIIIIFSQEIADGITQGIKICFNSIIPSLYIFTILCIFIVKTKIFNDNIIINILSKLLFGTDAKLGTIYFLSLFCGYPIGAKLCNQLYLDNQISKSEANKLLYFCINPGPAFLITFVGQSIYNNKSIGLIIFGATFVSVIIGARVLKIKCSNNYTYYDDIKITDDLIYSINSANKSMLSICSWIIISCSIINILNADKILSIISYFIEVTSGIINASENYSIYFIAFLIGFGGISVHMQVLSCSKDIKPKYVNILFFKIIQGFSTSLITFVFLKLLPINVNVSYVFSLSNSQNNSIISFTTLIFFIISSIIFMNKKCRNKETNMI